MTEGRAEPQERSVDNIIDLLNRLIKAHREALDARESLRQFRQNNAPPERGGEFENVAELAKFNNARARYEQKLAGLIRAHEEADERYGRLENEVRSILPAGSAITHDYGGEHYFIAHPVADPFQVQQLTEREYQQRRPRPPKDEPSA